jgi:hypothetical protein
MDAFDYSDEKVERPQNASALVWNILTVLVLLATLCVAALFLGLFLNPGLALNPFPPPTLPALAGFPTATPTPRNILPATWTPTVTPVPTQTSTPTSEPPTATPEATALLAVPSPVAGATGSPPPAGVSFVLQPGGPIAIPNIGHPEAGCGWMGVAGQATGLNNAPVLGLVVQLGGTLEGQALSPVTLTGTATQYGTGGYEFKLADQPVASSGDLWVQLLDQAGAPLSEKIYFDTFAECEKNLVLINFNQVR